MSEADSKVVLGHGVSLYKWIADLQSALVRRRCIGHVFHDINGIKPVRCPVMPDRGNSSPEEYARLIGQYEEDLQRFQEGEIEARSILAARIKREICPPNLMNMTAKQIYNHVLSVREEGANTPWETAVRELLVTRLTDTADSYCNIFMQHLLDANSAAEGMPNPNAEGLKGDQSISFEISAGLAGFLFVLGTEGVSWLDTWRQTKIYDVNNKYVSLDIMMSTLRQVAKGHEGVGGSHAQTARTAGISRSDTSGQAETGLDPDALCKKCRHKHRNRHCYRQHPGLRKRIKRNKGKAKATLESKYDNSVASSDSDNVALGAVARAASLRIKNRLLYDTGASHHFIRNKSDFLSIKKLSKPFEFDQAVGKTKLVHQGTCRLKLGNLSLNLIDALYSPESSCNIVSAVRLKEDHGIVAANRNEILVIANNNGPDKPIARLINSEGVLFVQELSEDELQSQDLVAPGIARVPNLTSAQRWHERLGHVGQKIFKQTIQSSIGLEGIDVSELGTCETCHLSKAQRYVSREKRPTPAEPLDEVFVDTVGKLTTAINGSQYAVIITDAKTRMRWVIITKGKDEIANELVNWIEYQSHQYGKRIRAVFRDGGSEFMRMKDHCDKHRIRTDISAPYTPEQNGAAEAANKVILQRARSLLIDAGMPPSFWPWAVEHSCFITNRLSCLRTRAVPLIDFLRGLRQPCNEKIDFTNLPRFGCRAYKYIDPKPSKFEARAEMGWFLGFQRNTNKNYLIYHPHWTPSNGWKWVESFTPHVTFNEDIMFGNMLSSIDKQKVYNYWVNEKDTPAEEKARIFQVPQQSVKTSQFEGENKAHEAAPKIPNLPSEKKNAKTSPPLTDQNSHVQVPPSVPKISDEVWPDSSLEPSTLLISSNTTNQPPRPPSSVDSDFHSLYEDSEEPSQKQVDTRDKELMRQGEHDDSVPTEGEGVRHQGEHNQMVRTESEEAERYDQIMTGWDPVTPLAGNKRGRSPEPEVIISKRGRPVKKLDYHKLHHGKMAKDDDNPKTWAEAMQSPDAKEWQKAAEEEISSLNKTGAIEIIDLKQLPKGRTIMKTKWVFKKKYQADGKLDKYRARCTVKGYSQRPGVDYKEALAPTPRPETGRIMLALANSFGATGDKEMFQLHS